MNNQYSSISRTNDLPSFCYSFDCVESKIMLIRKGKSKYSTIAIRTARTADETKELVNKLNAVHGITKAQEIAMMIGVIFGWDCPAANPSSECAKRLAKNEPNPYCL